MQELDPVPEGMPESCTGSAQSLGSAQPVFSLIYGLKPPEVGSALEWVRRPRTLRIFSDYFFKVARLQSEFCTKDVFESYEISYEKMPRNFPRNFRAFILWVRKNPAKIPKFPFETPKKKFTDELLQQRREFFLTSEGYSIIFRVVRNNLRKCTVKQGK